MKIFQPNGATVGKTDQVRGTALGSGNRVRTALPATSSDRVLLSKLSDHLAASLDSSPVHMAKLSQLQSLVSSNGYHVPAETVSHSLIQDALRFSAMGL